MKTVTVLSLIILRHFTACSQQPEVYSTSGVAVNGYDVVSYFTELKPVKGSKEYSFKWKDAEWMFSSDKNLELFKSNPEKYAPQFGGYCAFGTAEGHTAPTKPDAWTVVDDKLYLNYNTDVMRMWREKKLEYIKQGNKNWPGVLSK
jgi:YHS domain-containing protein